MRVEWVSYKVLWFHWEGESASHCSRRSTARFFTVTLVLLYRPAAFAEIDAAACPQADAGQQLQQGAVVLHSTDYIQMGEIKDFPAEDDVRAAVLPQAWKPGTTAWRQLGAQRHTAGPRLAKTPLGTLPCHQNSWVAEHIQHLTGQGDRSFHDSLPLSPLTNERENQVPVWITVRITVGITDNPRDCWTSCIAFRAAANDNIPFCYLHDSKITGDVR